MSRIVVPDACIAHPMAALPELIGKRLGCPGCNPDLGVCHGHVLVEFVDAVPRVR